jgi:hypothetical protein
MKVYEPEERILVKKMLGVADIAAMFDVEPKTVSMWRLRDPDFPEPDVSIGDMVGWDPERADEIVRRVHVAAISRVHRHG